MNNIKVMQQKKINLTLFIYDFKIRKLQFLDKKLFQRSV